MICLETSCKQEGEEGETGEEGEVVLFKKFVKRMLLQMCFLLLLFSSYLKNWLNKTKVKCEARPLLRKPPHVTSICWLGPAAPEQVVPERLSARLNINSPGKQPRGRWLEGERLGGDPAREELSRANSGPQVPS